MGSTGSSRNVRVVVVVVVVAIQRARIRGVLYGNPVLVNIM